MRRTIALFSLLSVSPTEAYVAASASVYRWDGVAWTREAPFTGGGEQTPPHAS